MSSGYKRCSHYIEMDMRCQEDACFWYYAPFELVTWGIDMPKKSVGPSEGMYGGWCKKHKPTDETLKTKFYSSRMYFQTLDEMLMHEIHNS